MCRRLASNRRGPEVLAVTNSERDRAVACEGGLVNKRRSRRKSSIHPCEQAIHAISSIAAIGRTIRTVFPVLPPAPSLLRSSLGVFPAENSSDIRFESHFRLPCGGLAEGLWF